MNLMERIRNYWFIRKDNYQYFGESGRIQEFEVYVVKKMSINVDIFFCEKLLKLIFNSLRLITGRPNNLIFTAL